MDFNPTFLDYPLDGAPLPFALPANKTLFQQHGSVTSYRRGFLPIQT